MIPEGQQLHLHKQPNDFYDFHVIFPSGNRSSHLGIHKQTNACWSIHRSQTVFIHFKISIKYAESGNYEAFVVVHCYQLQLIQPQILTNKCLAFCYYLNHLLGRPAAGTDI